MKLSINILLLFLTLLCGTIQAQKPLGVKEVDVYKLHNEPNTAVIQMAYASSVVKNPEAWKPSTNANIQEVDLVFSRYPLHKKDWLTHYDSLLNHRKAALELLIPGISANPAITWNIILQTSCTTEPEAQALFHGAIVKYSLPKLSESQESSPSKKYFNPILEKPAQAMFTAIDDLLSGTYAFPDSVVWKVFNRNNWNNMLVVNDWTGSMYEFGAQVVLWNKLNTQKRAVKGLVFFNDGDAKKDHKKQVGKTGGIYQAKADNMQEVITTMNKVMKKGDGGDVPENDVEALLYAIDKNHDFDDLILVADNRSEVRDLELAYLLKTPVKIILCGTYPGGPVLVDYLELARRTKGSIHTISEDILNLSILKNGDEIELLNIRYKLHGGRFERLTNLKENLIN